MSSTFADMHFERDYLRVHALAELAERLRERRHYLETIDLRHGIETSSEEDLARREMKVLKVCLDEIKRSRPFFVGILGDRYGSALPRERLETAAGDAGLDVDVAGCSVTELEILYGVLESTGQRSRSWFYIRELDYGAMPEELRARFDDRYATDPEAHERVSRLEALKKRLREELPDRVRTYRATWDPNVGEDGAVVGLDELATMVRDDLWGDMDAETSEWLRQAPSTWQEADLRSLGDFVEGRTRGFVERPEVTRPLIEFALSTPEEGADWAVCLIGESGSGKSSIFGRVYKELTSRDDVLVLGNAAGIYPGSGSVDRMLRRWIRELATFLRTADPLEKPQEQRELPRLADDPLRPALGGDSVEEVEETFASFLGRASVKTRVVLLIDALNQFAGGTRVEYLTWLPKLWPENARLVATAIPGGESEALAERTGAAVRPLAPVTPSEAREIARRFYEERFHRETNERVLDILLSKTLPDGRPACGNPLWLELALQEMNLLRADDYTRAERDFPELGGGERIEALQVAEAKRLPGDAAGVYSELLERAESDFGDVRTRATVNLIALGRTGWRESDLASLMEPVCGLEWDELAFAGVRRALGTHLVQRGANAQWDLFHAQLRECVLARNLPDGAERRRLHGLIADHLLSLPEDEPLRVSEAMVHLVGQGNLTRAARYYGSLETASDELAAASAALARCAGQSERGAAFAAHMPTAEHLTDDEIRGVSTNLQYEGLTALEREVGLEQQFELLSACREALERLVARDSSNVALQRNLGLTVAKIGDVLRWQGDLGGARESYTLAMALSERVLALDPSNTVFARDLGVIQERVADVLHVQGDSDGALELYRASSAVSEHLADLDPLNAVWLRDLVVGHEKVGGILLEQGNSSEALECYRAAVAVRERLGAGGPSSVGLLRDLSAIQDRIGDLLLAQGSLEEALECYQVSLEMSEGLAASDPSSAAWQHDLGVALGKIGDVLRDKGHMSKALGYYRRSMAVLERLSSTEPSNAEWQHGLGATHDRVGDVLLAEGDLQGALESYQASMEIAGRLTAGDPTNSVWRRELGVCGIKLGDVLRAQGSLEEALKSYQGSVAHSEELAAGNQMNTDLQSFLTVGQDRSGDVLRAKGNLSEALEYYRDSLAVRERLAAIDPWNAAWQRDLVVSHHKLASLAQEAGEADREREHWRSCHKILTGMRSAGMYLDPPLLQLLELLEAEVD